MEKYGDDWPDKPVGFVHAACVKYGGGQTDPRFVDGVPKNDMIQWVIDEGLSRNNTDEEMVQRVLLVNFAAIHTSSNVCLVPFVIVALV